MAESHSRTLICSVLFIDIVEYSRKPVVEQIALKDRFNELLSHALRGVAVNDRIILDTGDGAAISFIGDPEDALFVASDLRDAIAKETDPIDLELGTRMGINLGPVRLVKDINGQPNIIGDGINVAQRVMSFAKPSQVLVSRSYYDVVSNLASEYAKLFSYEGSRTDKHVREHEIYVVGHHEGAL
ncbi:MAG TPA: adenylate/guanylate cyclase domain-containing protein, partial [Burkholderiales bacterium]|nr:adenylate/guanylate cyclase domain-containing protein [Burkholderiales bacterium]